MRRRAWSWPVLAWRVGLAVCVLAVIGWLVSLSVVVHLTPCSRFRVSLDRGAVAGLITTPLGAMHDPLVMTVPNRWGMQWGFMSRQTGRWHYGGPFDVLAYLCVVPLWAVFAFGAIGAVTGRVLVWRGGRVRPRTCRGCGYHLAGLAEGAVCPECGRDERAA